MSKKKGQRGKRRKKSRPLLACHKCHAPVDKSPGEWLRALAGLLNDAERAGVKIKVSHGWIHIREGFVLRHDSGRWQGALLTPWGDEPLVPDDDWDQD